MTNHQKAIAKALIDLDGRGTNKQIYELAKKYADYGGKTPENTIRRDLQQSTFIRPVEGKRGVWELIPFTEIVETLNNTIAEKDVTIESVNKKNEHLQEELQDAKCFSRLAVVYMEANKNKSQNKREEIKAWLLDMAGQLKLIIPNEVLQLINNFDDVVPLVELIAKLHLDVVNFHLHGGNYIEQQTIKKA